jgi:hypothetical protein
MTLTKTIARYGRVDLLCIDELGYMALDKRGAELLFQVLTKREEKASVAIASNEAFSGWTKTFTDPRLCAAIVDRLTFGGNIIEAGTDLPPRRQVTSAFTNTRSCPTPTPTSQFTHKRRHKIRSEPPQPSRQSVPLPYRMSTDALHRIGGIRRNQIWRVTSK